MKGPTEHRVEPTLQSTVRGNGYRNRYMRVERDTPALTFTFWLSLDDPLRPSIAIILSSVRL